VWRGVAANQPGGWASCGTGCAVPDFVAARMEIHGRSDRKDFQGVHRATILFDDREAAKNLSTVEKACRELGARGADRRALLVAVGGGVVGDVAGLLRQVMFAESGLVAHSHDARGAGGQRRWGQNRRESSGREKPGRCVLSYETGDCHPELLRTLPPREFRSGIYEIIKYGVIGDAKLFQFWS